MRWAERGPMPGRRPSSSTSSWMGPAYTAMSGLLVLVLVADVARELELARLGPRRKAPEERTEIETPEQRVEVEVPRQRRHVGAARGDRSRGRGELAPELVHPAQRVAQRRQHGV